MGLFNNLENATLNAMLGTGATLLGSIIEIGLSTTTPTDAGGNITEPVGASYARVSVANNSTNWPAALNGAKSNATPIVFAAATGSGWGTVTHWILYSASQPMIWGVLDNGEGSPLPRTVASGDVFRFLANQLRISLD
jgi:hypothetical protein